MSSAPPILKSFFKKFKKTKKSNFEIDFKKIDISLISIHAIKTIEVLEDNGFEAYLVGPHTALSKKKFLKLTAQSLKTITTLEL